MSSRPPFIVSSRDLPETTHVYPNSTEGMGPALYPLNPSRRGDLPRSEWWNDAPARSLGPHDALPEARRK